MLRDKKVTQTVIIFLFIYLLSSLFLAFGSKIVAQRGFPLGFDIYLRWEAARAFWQGQSPYTDEVTARSDFDIYGRPRAEGEVAYTFYDPAYTAIILFPISLIPLHWAGVLWSALGLAILIMLLLYWGWNIRPRPAPWLLGLIVLSGIFFRPAIMTILNGQYSLFIVGLAILSWWAISRENYFLSGVLLAISTIKPSIFLFVPFVIILWALRWKKWNILTGFLASLAVLGIVTLIQIGWWIPDFLYRLQEYSQSLSQQIIFSWSLKDVVSFPGILWLALSAALLFVGLKQLFNHDEFPYLACMAALNLNLIVTPHIVEYDLGVLLIPLFFLGTKWSGTRHGIAAWLFLIWFPWISWFITIWLGGSTLQWQNLVWQSFPNLILAVIWYKIIFKKDLATLRI